MQYKDRIQNLRKKFIDTLDAVLVTSQANITYFTGYANFSDIEREAFLLISKKKEFLITDGRYSEAAEKHIPHVKILERNAKQSLTDILKKLSEEERIGKVGLEYHNLTIAEERAWVTELFPQNWDFNPESLRETKEEDEIKKIEAACTLGDSAFEYILDKIKPGLTEQQIAFELEMFIKGKGADISFPPIVAFGTNSSVPHHETGPTKLHRGSIVLLDFGVKLNAYCSDMTRTIYFGKADAQFKKMYNTVLVAQEKATEYLSNYSSNAVRSNQKASSHSSKKSSNNKSKELTSIAQGVKQTHEQIGLRARDVDKVAREYITSNGFPSIPHSLGHGVGLQVHEAPHVSSVSNEQLSEGMVFSIEPGIYIPHFGGVRIEDLVTLEKSGPRLLTHSKKELIEL